MFNINISFMTMSLGNTVPSTMNVHGDNFKKSVLECYKEFWLFFFLGFAFVIQCLLNIRIAGYSSLIKLLPSYCKAMVLFHYYKKEKKKKKIMRTTKVLLLLS